MKLRDLILAAGYAAIGYGLAAMPAKAGAEVFELWRGASWTVSYVNGQRGSWCELSTLNRYSEDFTLSAYVDDRYTVTVSIDVGDDLDGAIAQRGWERSEWEVFDLKIGGTRWEFEPWMVTDMGNGMVLFGVAGINLNFRRALAQGSYMENDFESGWSLRGSAAGLRELDQCRRRLGSY